MQGELVKLGHRSQRDIAELDSVFAIKNGARNMRRWDTEVPVLRREFPDVRNHLMHGFQLRISPIGGRGSGVIWAGWGLGGENAVQCAQCCRQAGGADCAESDQEA